MRNLVIAAAITVTAALGVLAFHASAAPPAAPVPLAGPYTPIHPAACGGRDVNCPPGKHWVCGPAGHNCWCAPC